MVIDASAVLAILMGEKEAESFARCIEANETRVISSLSALHASVAIEAKKGDAGARECDLLLLKAKIKVAALDEDLYLQARRIWKVYGRGRHAANLTVNECCSVALCSSLGEPLLYKSPGLEVLACSDHQVFSPLLCSNEILRSNAR